MTVLEIHDNECFKVANRIYTYENSLFAFVRE